MRRHSIIARLGPSDANHVTLHMTGSVETEIRFIKGYRRLAFGLGQMLDQLSGRGIRPSEAALDLAILASCVTAGDTRISRARDSQDSWTREIDLHLPVQDVALWTGVASLIENILKFLTGDRWRLFFRGRHRQYARLVTGARRLVRPPFSGTCLFSGGLDSFVGAVDLLEAGQTPLFVSHYWDLSTSSQVRCAQHWVRLFFVEKFSPYSWAFLPADASLQCSVRGDSNQASAYPRRSGGQPSLETVPNTVGLSPSGALPSGHSRGVLVRFHGQGDRPVMALTTGFQGRRFDVPEARTGVPRIDLPSPAPCAAADAVFADAKAFLSSNEARQMSESELERELHRRGQKLVRKLLQGHHDQRSPGQVAGPAEDASGVECSARREHDSHAETTSGTMQVVGLGCARRGHDGLHPLDAALNLLPERSLVDMRRRVTIATASRAPPRTPWKPQWYSTLSTWQRRCGVRCSSPAP